MHSMRALTQFAHGCFLSHLTLRLRQVTQDLGLRFGLALLDDWDGFWTRLSVLLDVCRTPSDISMLHESAADLFCSSCSSVGGLRWRKRDRNTVRVESK